jgi:hypothetical protein
MVLLGDFTFKRCGSSNGCGVTKRFNEIRTSTTTTTLAVNITLGHADFITTTGVRGPYDWTLPNIVDDDALRSVFLEGQITSIPIPPITRYNRTSPVVANSANIAIAACILHY